VFSDKTPTVVESRSAVGTLDDDSSAASDCLEPASDSTPTDSEALTLSQEPLSSLLEVLTTILGPVAPSVVREQIAVLGESHFAFPKNRTRELVKLIEREITPEELARFKASISKEFHIFSDY
jgi:hypothetical protein